uniref:Putative secreted protein n=1 Tax=Anopheles triannulatus TaxID=58253 RepID=A0A2M4B1R9_9DIPT
MLDIELSLFLLQCCRLAVKDLVEARKPLFQGLGSPYTAGTGGDCDQLGVTWVCGLSFFRIYRFPSN